MKRIYLVDVSSMFFRAFYAVRPLTSPAGVPVNAVYGFLSMLIKLLKEEKPDYMVFCYDRKEPSFRKEMYQEYKANRSEMPEDLGVQIPYIKKFADLLGIPSMEVPNYEADDIIGTLTHWGIKQGVQVVIVSGDKDFGQLITDNVILYDTMKDHRYNVAGVFEKWGVRPDQFIDYLSIVGDASDNIPGVRGIGEKGAIKLLEQFKSLEDIYENIDKVESKSIREKLITSKENALLSKKLVTICIDIPVSHNLEDYTLKPWHIEELRALLQEMNFKTFEKNLLGSGQLGFAIDASIVPAANTPPSMTASSFTSAQLSQPMVASAPLNEPRTGDTVVFAATEFQEHTTTIREVTNWLQEGQALWGFHDTRGVFIANEKNIYLISDHEYLGKLTDTFKIQWSGFDLKELWHKIGAKEPVAVWDSMLAAYVVRASDCSDFTKIYNRYVTEPVPEFATPSQVLNAQIHLARVLQHELNSHEGDKVYRDLDLPLATILLGMEKWGIRIDRELLKTQSEVLKTDLQGLETAIHKEAGEAFNIGSPKQLGVVLFEKLGLPVGKKTKTGYSTDTDVLAGLDHPIAKLVLQWRELSKLKSTYVDSLPELIDPKDDRVHTSFNQALTTTGRLSSTHPNLQNIPIRTPRGQAVRKAFVAAPRMKLLSVDYSQIELRILAHISEDPNLCRAFADDLDIHSATAAEIYNVPLAQVTSELRRAAKAVNFGIAYGQGAFGLAENLGIPRGEAKEIIDRYFVRFKNVRDYIEGTIKTAHEKGYVETLFGRRRYIEELSSKNMALKKFGERAAINAPIQGTASDLVKKAMIEVGAKIPVRMLLQVHDELIFEDFEDNLKQHAPQLVSIMENVTKFRVPLKVNYAIGNNWDEAH
jgi:DNA polymerase-1